MQQGFALRRGILAQPGHKLIKQRFCLANDHEISEQGQGFRVHEHPYAAHDNQRIARRHGFAASGGKGRYSTGGQHGGQPGIILLKAD